MDPDYEPYESLDCKNLTFTLCCNILTYNVELGNNNTIHVFDVCCLCLYVLGLIVLLWRLQKIMFQQLSVYIKLLIVFIITGTLEVIVYISPLEEIAKTIVALHMALKLGLYKFMPTINVWIILFLFQTDTSRKSIIVSTSITAILHLIIIGVETALYLYTNSYFLGDFVRACVFGAAYFIILVFPWSKVSKKFRPRPAIYPLLVVQSLSNILNVIEGILRLNNILVACPMLISDVLEVLAHPFILYWILTLDSEYWRQEHLYLIEEEEQEWLIQDNKTSSAKRLEDFPRVKWSEVEIRSVIGQGAASNVYKGKWRGTEVAIKKYKLKSMDESESDRVIESLLSESQILKSLRHPNIVQFLGVVSESPHLAIITEFMNRGSLDGVFRKIRNRKATPLDINVKIKILIDISKGMNYLHSNEPIILHRDLKSPNILLDQWWNCKVADFGLSRLKSTTNSQVMTPCGTPQWAAPEIWKREKYTEKADVWSFGVIVWEFSTYEIPYSGESLVNILGYLSKEEKLTVPEDAHKVLAQLMESCWEIEPFLRPSFSDILTALQSYQEKNTANLVFPNLDTTAIN